MIQDLFEICYLHLQTCRRFSYLMVYETNILRIEKGHTHFLSVFLVMAGDSFLDFLVSICFFCAGWRIALLIFLFLSAFIRQKQLLEPNYLPVFLFIHIDFLLLIFLSVPSTTFYRQILLFHSFYPFLFSPNPLSSIFFKFLQKSWLTNQFFHPVLYILCSCKNLVINFLHRESSLLRITFINRI